MSYPEIQFGPITHDQISAYAVASGDNNEIHLNPEFARAAGFPDVIAHGMLSMGLVGCALESWGFPVEKLKNFETKFKDVVHVGDYLTAKMNTSATSSSTVEVILTTQDGREVCVSSAETAAR